MNKQIIMDFFMRKDVIMIKTICLSIIATAAYYILTGMPIRTSYATAIVLLVTIVLLAEKKMHLNHRQRQCGLILGVIYSNFTIASSYLMWTEHVFGTVHSLFLNLTISVIGTMVFCVAVANILIGLLDKFISLEEQKSKKESKWFVPLCFMIIMLCWFVYFLAFYPGVLTNDSVDQLEQVMGICSYSNHHPIVHTIFLKFIYDIVYEILKDKNAAVSGCIFVQMLIMAGIFTYMINVMRNAGIKKKYLFLCILYVAICPINAYFSITMWKDVLFGGFALLFAVIIWQISRIDMCTMPTIKKITMFASFFVIGLLFCLWRSNGLYAYIFCIPFLLIGKSYKKIRVPVGIIMVTTVILVLIFNGPIMKKCNVEQPDFVEHISIPIQHIARVVVDNGYENLPQDDIELLSYVVDVDKIPWSYGPHIADPMKKIIREGDPEYLEENKIEYLKLWIRWGFKYPASYLKAQIDATRGFWDPNVDYWATTDIIAGNTMGLYRQSLLSDTIVKLISDFQSFCMNIPILESLWKIGFYVWIEIFCLIYCIKNKKAVYLFLPTIAIFLTLMIATPVAAEFRYGYSFVTSMPFFIGISFQHKTTVG